MMSCPSFFATPLAIIPLSEAFMGKPLALIFNSQIAPEVTSENQKFLGGMLPTPLEGRG